MKAQDGFTFHPYPPTYTIQQLRMPNDLFADLNNNVWVAFRTIGLGRFSGNTFTIYDSTNSGIPSGIVYSVVVDHLNNLWAGTDKGLVRFNGSTWTVFDSLNSLLPGNVYKLHVHGNKLWCGTLHGAASYDGSNWTIYNTQNSGISGDNITAFASGNNGGLWIGTSNAGISEFYNNTWITFNSSNSGLSNNAVKKIIVTANNDTWIITYPEMFVKRGSVIFNYLEDLYSGVFPSGSITTFAGNYFRDLNGKLVFPVYDPDQLRYQKMNGNDVDMFMAAHSYDLTPGGTQNTIFVPDKNNHCWSTTLLKQAGVYGIASFNRSEAVAVPFVFSNTNSKTLDINNVKAAMLNRGDMHWDLMESKYSVPKKDGKKPVFASALWMGGIDDMQQLHLAAQTYRQTGNDFWPGPVDTITGLADTATAMLYDKMWKIDRNMIDEFRLHYNNASVANGTYTIPEPILTWPAHGTGNITRDLAPFTDFNGDGKYNPLDGDHPLIKGDQMLYWIINDALGFHGNSGATPLGAEIHCSAYAYFCDQLPEDETVMQQTTFYHYRIINRSPNDYRKFYIGLWCDMDLGHYGDDYIGCDTVLNAGFTYNGDNNDEGVYGYGVNPPIQNIKILDGPLADAGDGADNDHDGTIDEPGENCLMSGFMTYWGMPGPTDDPNGDQDFYNYLQCRWLDGSPLTYGGSGNNPTGTPVTKFLFSGTPYDTTAWTEASSGNIPEDRHLFLCSGPVTLPAGGETSIDFAYVFTRDTMAPNGISTSIARNKSDLKLIQNWFDNQNFPSCMQTRQFTDDDFEIFILPNPATDVIYIQSNTELRSASYMVYDIIGRKVLSGLLERQTIKISGLTKGMYLLMITNNGKEKTKKFIRQ